MLVSLVSFVSIVSLVPQIYLTNEFRELSLTYHKNFSIAYFVFLTKT